MADPLKRLNQVGGEYDALKKRKQDWRVGKPGEVKEFEEGAKKGGSLETFWGNIKKSVGLKK